MNLLHRKLWRDLAVARWQFVAITLVAALGVAMFQGSLSSYIDQNDSYRTSYAHLNFADVTVDMKRAPRSAVSTLRRLPGVRALEGRITQVVEVEQDAGRRPRVVGLLVTKPTSTAATINQTRLLQGHPLGTTSRREVLLEAAFAKANHYQVGDRIYPKFQGRRVTFVVAGIVSSPEYIYPIIGKQYSFPMPELFGVLFVMEDQVAPLLGLAGSINQIVVRTEPGQAQSVGQTIERRLHAYGTEKPMLQADQPSNRLLQSDLEGNKPFLVIMPMLFLGSAALAVALVLARWVMAQRGQIGFLRASGFPARAILAHYLEVGLAIGTCGGIVGIGLGILLDRVYAVAYERVLTMPYSANTLHPEVIVLAFSLSVVACLLGALGPARQAARTNPAEAMRGQMPSQPLLLARLHLPLTLTLPIRNLMRRPMRTLGTATGVASGVVLMTISGAYQDSLEKALGSYFQDNRYDISITFVPERSQEILAFLRQWPGVLRVEPSLEIPIHIAYNRVEKDSVAVGILPDLQLRRLPGSTDKPIIPLPGTLLMTNALSSRLHSEAGDLLHVEYIQNTRERHAEVELHAGESVHQLVGTMTYMRLGELQRRFAMPLGMPPDAITGARLAVAPGYLASVRGRLNRTDGIAMVLTFQEVENQVHELTAFAQTFIRIFYLLGLAMAFAVAYTTTDIVLWERTRELATLRTMGFGMRRLAILVTLENLLVAGLGALLGTQPGVWIATYLMKASDTEGFSLEVTVSLATYITAVGGCLATVVLAQWPGLRRIRNLDLASTIRLREE